MSIPNNAVLANAVTAKDLSSEKGHLAHVSAELEKAPHTLTGGVHLGPSDKQADFAPGTFHQHSHTSVSGATSSGGNECATASSGEISVKSNVTMDTTQETKPQAAAQIQALLSRLSTTTSQVDEYSRRANDKISDEANRQVQRVIGETQMAQDALLKDASARSLEIEQVYSSQLKAFLQELDASKASNLASLEKDLNFRQESLLSSAREQMDDIYQNATAQKIGVMNAANRNLISDVDRLTDQVKVLGEAEVERRMNSTTTTVITTQTTADSKSEMHLNKEHASTSATNINKRSSEINVTNEPRSNTVTRI